MDAKTTKLPQPPTRDQGFARRLTQACDNSPHCPPYNSGRLVWIVQQFKLRYATILPLETPRKWFAGQTKPRLERCEQLAEMLDVNPVWLFNGIDTNMPKREGKARNAMADGAVNVVAGFIRMDGGTIAFPEDQQQPAVDIHAIIKGASYAFHISTAEEKDGELVFQIPTGWENVVVLGIVRDGLSIRAVEIQPEAIELHGKWEHGRHFVTVADDDGSLREISDFSKRL